MTIIGHHFLKQWELGKEKSIGTRKKSQNKEKMIVDVNCRNEEEKQSSCNRKQGDHKGISNPTRES